MTAPRAREMADAMIYIAAGAQVQAQFNPANGRTRYCISNEGITMRIAERGDAAHK